MRALNLDETESERFLKEENDALRERLREIRNTVDARCAGCPFVDLDCLPDCDLRPVRRLIVEKS